MRFQDTEELADRPLAEREKVLMQRIEARIESGALQLPQLPSTGMKLISLTNDPAVEFDEIVRIISTDPVLSSQLLKVVNSALFATAHPVESIRDGIARLGLRRLRSMIYSLSMRSLILGSESLAAHAEEVWRQSFSCGTIAEAIAGTFAIDSEKAFLLGLLHDIGRIPLLAILRDEARLIGRPSDTLIGKVFHRYHERAGAALARVWKLSDEFRSVAGCHHRFEDNDGFPRSAALASLTHRLDLYFCTAEDERLAMEPTFPEMDYLGLLGERRLELLETALAAFEKANGLPASSGEAPEPALETALEAALEAGES